MHRLFDSHLDLAWNALTWKRDLRRNVAELNRSEAGMTDEKFRGRATTTLPEMRRGHVVVCLGTMMGRVPYGESQLHGSTLDFPSHEQVYAFASCQRAYYEVLAQIGEVELIHDATQLTRVWERPIDSTADSPIGIILAMEGADAIVTPEQVPHWFELGLRCVSLVHYGQSAYAVGTGQEGPLSEAGHQLLRAMERVGMILDLTHLSDESFWQAVDAFDGPICASHQACRSIIPGQRQFDDRQLRTIIGRHGVIGVPCDAWMLHPCWERGKTSRDVVSIEALVDHLDHICQLAGNTHHACLGSDLDGGYGTEQTPTGIDTIADLQRLAPIMSQRGYSDADIRQLMGGNWYDFFRRHLP